MRIAKMNADVHQAAVASAEDAVQRRIIASPIDGVVLARSVEPGEYAAPGGALLVVGNLNALTIIVYVPEDRLGEVSLGQTAGVTVDSWPGETFNGTVEHIADQAEFTPRNVQTVEGRKTTVFAVRLSIANPEAKLKPGMPADVAF